MGHTTAKDTYAKLRERLDRYPVGAPGQSTIFEILQTIYTEEEARIACRMPLRFSSLKTLSRRTGIDAPLLEKKLDAMAGKGIVMDIRKGDEARYILNPTIVGFFEFSMMRIRDEGDIDQKKLAGLFHRYMLEEADFAEQFSSKTRTTPFRTLVHENTLPENYSEVLDWERATHVVNTAGKWAIGICHCRHVMHHMDADCSVFRMEDSCLSLGPAVDYLVSHSFAREIDRDEAAALLEESRDAGMVHICDNVQRRPTFICNCCGCCCEVLNSLKNFRIFGSTFSSNFLADVDGSECTGCLECLKACPVDAIDRVVEDRVVKGKKRKYIPRVDESVCLGCGVCAMKCKNSAMQMKARPKRRIAPESAFARVITMALEQGKLQDMLFDADAGAGGFISKAFVGAVLSLPPAKQILAVDAVKSRFVGYVVSRMSGKKK